MERSTKYVELSAVLEPKKGADIPPLGLHVRLNANYYPEAIEMMNQGVEPQLIAAAVREATGNSEAVAVEYSWLSAVGDVGNMGILSQPLEQHHLEKLERTLEWARKIEYPIGRLIGLNEDGLDTLFGKDRPKEV